MWQERRPADPAARSNGYQPRIRKALHIRAQLADFLIRSLVRSFDSGATPCAGRSTARYAPRPPCSVAFTGRR
jgi:hypothetical protein